MGHKGASGHPQYISGAGESVNQSYLRFFGTPGPTTLDKGSLTLGRSLDVPRISRYDVDTETPRPEKLLVDFDTTVNDSPTDISGKGNHGVFYNGASYSAVDKAFTFDGTNDAILGIISNPAGDWVHSISFWFKLHIDQSTISTVKTENRIQPFQIARKGTGGVSRTSDLPSADLAGHVSGLDVVDSTFNWYFYGNDASFPISGIKANEWHHITFAYEGGGAAANRHCFLDGVEYLNTGASTANLNVFANSILAIGKDHARTAGSPSYFPGKISNFKIYNVALEASEAKKLYNLGRTGRSMVISDTAVGIGKVPEAQLDVRGRINATGSISSNNPGWSYWITSAVALRVAIGNASATSGSGAGTFINYNDASNSQNWETGSKAGPYADRVSGNFNHTTGIYSAPEKGAYFVSCSWSIAHNQAGSAYDDTMYMKFVTTGNPAGNSTSTTWESGDGYNDRGSTSSAKMHFNPGTWSGHGVENAWCMSEILLLNAGSTVRVYLEGVGAEGKLNLLSLNFSGIKIA
jgi:hypothetical protein